jgi:hypothetical protein
MRSSFATTVYAVTLRLPDIWSTAHDQPLTRRRVRDTGEKSSVRPTIEDYRTSLSPDRCGALRAFDWPKAPCAARRAHGPRANHLAHTPDAPRRFRRGPPAQCAEIPRRSGLPCRRRARGAPRSPATITPLAACGANAWRSPTPRCSRATPGAMRTRQRCATPGICAGRVTIPDRPGACRKPGGGWPNATRWTKPFACTAAEIDNIERAIDGCRRAALSPMAGDPFHKYVL